MPPREAVPTTPVTIRFPVKFHTRLTEYARAHGRPFTAQVLYWLEDALEQAEKGEHHKP